MKKYKLLKDLPNCKAGKIITITNLDNPHTTFVDDCGSDIQVFWKDPSWFSEAKEPEFKAGDWVLLKEGNIVKIRSMSGDKEYDKHDFSNAQLGFLDFSERNSGRGHWFRLKEIHCLATREKIKSHLIKTASEKGYKNGIEYIDPIHKRECDLKGFEDMDYDKRDDFLTDGYGGSIYEKGKWAEIIREEKIMVGDFEVDFQSDGVIVGGRNYHISQIRRAKDLMNNLDIFRFEFQDCSGRAVWVSRDIVRDIYKRLTK